MTFEFGLSLDVSPQNVIVLETVSQSNIHGDVSRAPVGVIAHTVYDWLERLGFQRWAEHFIKRAELEGILRKPIHGICL